MIDVNTLVLSEAVVSLSIWLIFIFYRQTQKTYDGFGHWQSGSLMIFIAYASMAAREIPLVKSSHLFSFTLFFAQNFILILAIVVRLDGTFRFVLRRRLWKLMYLLPVAALAVMSYFYLVTDMMALRGLIWALAMVSAFTMTAIVFFMGGDKKNKLYFTVGMINIIWGLVIMLRSLSWIVLPYYRVLDPVFFNVFLFFITPVFNIGLGISLLLVNSQRMQNELKESEDKFETAFRSSPYAMIIAEIPSGRITNVNEGFLNSTGFSSENLIGKTTLELKLWVNENERDAVLYDLAAGKRIRGREFLFRKITGEIIIGLFSAEAVIINNRPHILASIIDITERRHQEEEQKKLEQQLHHTQKLESIGILAGGIAHDFNNILMVILGNTELAMADISEVSPARQRLENINKASMRAADICRQMLAYSGKGLFVIKSVDLSEMVMEMAGMLDVSISKKVVLNYNLTKGLPLIEVDLAQIHQIIMNLVINASEAIGDRNGVINLSTGVQECDSRFLIENKMQDELSEGHYVYLEVEDTGCGIDHDTLSKIFDPFFSTKLEGRGLGLSAVQGIVKSHHGCMTILTEPGKGTIFKVLFPIPERPADLIFNEKSKQEGIWKGTGTILLVDDEEPLRSLGLQVLEGMGFDVLLAGNGREALEIFSMHRDEITCVILDLAMPQMDGEETFRKMIMIKPDLMVIISSGYSEQDIERRFHGKNISGIIHKPYRIDNLAGLLKKILAEKQSRDDKKVVSLFKRQMP
jgi:two-component system, cell cycle sensor histidine kinase and response regulator CckA